MHRIIRQIITGICLAYLMTAAIAVAGPSGGQHAQISNGQSMVYGGQAADQAKVAVDTLLIMGPWGSGAAYNGQFQSPNGGPAWNGWTSHDLTKSEAIHWHADTYHAISGVYSAWCGDPSFPLCNQVDPDVGGYGNDWVDVLEWRGTVANPALPCTLSISAVVDLDTEPSYDYAYLSTVQNGTVIDLWSMSGSATALPLNFQTIYQPADYEGANHDEVVVRFRFISDGGFSDEDCQWETAGAIRVDDVQFNLSNGSNYSHDFEDGTLGEFQADSGPGVGNFGKIWTNPGVSAGFENDNVSPVVAFIDDGVVVPGTGGTMCIDWCYGPGGYIVNNTGGLLGPSALLENGIHSPPMALPVPGNEGVELSFDVWRDEQLTSTSPGLAFSYAVKSTADPDSSALATALWVSSNFLFAGGPDWLRAHEPLSDLIVPGARWLQIELSVREFGLGFDGTNGTPAPYFDNVRVVSFPFHGPVLKAQTVQLAQDAFPENGGLDPANLGLNNVRFDMGASPDILAGGATHSAGDSLIVSVAPQRASATLVGLPRLHWRLMANPLFTAAERTSGLGTSGFVDGWLAVPGSQFSAAKYAFDLPDSGFLFPGDVLHYYFEATDTQGGLDQTATLPADTTGFSNFADPGAYSPIFEMRALPSWQAAAAKTGTLTQPGILFWDDGGPGDGRDEWYGALANLGLRSGVDYDIFQTNQPGGINGNSLAGEATLAQITGYSDLIYTSGVQNSNTLNDGVVWGPDDDIGLLSAWLQLGGRDMLLAGDDLAGDLSRLSPLTQAFAQDWLGVDLAVDNALEIFGRQSSPLVSVTAGNPVIASASQWHGVGARVIPDGNGSLITGFRRFDGVTARPGAQRLAQFLDATGVPSGSGFSAATLNVRADVNARIISLPYDFRSIGTVPGSAAKLGAPLATRALVLQDILTYFGQTASGAPSSVPAATVFAARAYPNPFNPQVTIAYEMPSKGRLRVEVYDVRGRLVRRVADQQLESGPGQVRWDGRTADGEAAAAGVYFYKVRASGQELVGKIALIK